jgi:hypothetical protein
VNYRRDKGQFRFRGVNLNCAVDSIPKDQLGIATNVRPNQQGTLSTRPALSLVLKPSGDPVHSLKTFTGGGLTHRFSGAAGGLFMDNTPVDSGYSGKPLSFAAYQPEQSVNPFLYVADSKRYSKLRSDGTRFNVGIVPPAGPPDAELIKPLFSEVSAFEDSTVWPNGGTASTPTTNYRVPVSTTLTEILYDSGLNGWACVAFSASGSPGVGGLTGWIQPGADVTIGFGLGTQERVILVDVAPANSNATTTISAIAYDNGSVGACCVVLSSIGGSTNLKRNSLLQLGAENIRVLSVAIGEDNSVSFRCVTTGTHASGETVTFFNSARVYLLNNHAAGEEAEGQCVTTPVTAGVGTITYTPGTPLDLSQINGRPVTDSDYMHISILVDALQNISLIRILLDVDSAINDFAHNYFYADITANILQPAATGGQSNASAAVAAVSQGSTLAQIQILEDQIASLTAAGDLPGSTALQTALAQLNAESAALQQLYTGASQFTEVLIPISALTRVGNDQTVGLSSVAAIRVEITCIGSVNVTCDSWWVGGTYGPNNPVTINSDNPTKYCFRYRSTITGAQSTWSPLNRGGLFPQRQGIMVSAVFSTDPQVDTIDIARVGASIDGTPQELASITNNTAGGTGTYFDNYADAQLGDQVEPGDNQPWPIQQPPINGTCSVVGTTVFATSVAIPANLCEGTIVLIDGIATVIRGLPDPNAFQVEDNLPATASALLQIGSPITFGNALPYLAGPFDETFWGFGDPVNPGRIYFSNRGAPDAAKTSNFVDLTNSSEPGLGLAIWNGYVVAMTAEQFLIGTTTGNVGTPYSFTTTSVGCGLLAPWAFTTGPAIFFWTRNGIAVTDLGPAKVISAEDLYPYLPHEGIAGIEVNHYQPPPLSVMPRLAYCKDGWLYVDFRDVEENYRALAYDTNKPGWWFDTYTPGALLHYQDEQENSTTILVGCTDGTIEQFSSGPSDAFGVINCQVRMGASNFDDIRSLKQAIDLALNINGVVSVSVLAKSWEIAVLLSVAVTGTIGVPQIIPIATAYDPTKLYLDFALDLQWTGLQQIVEYDLGYLQNPMLAADFVANPTPLGFEGYGHVREVILNTIAPAAMTANLVIGCEFPGSITVAVAIAAGPQRQYIPLPPNKGMLYEWSLQGNGLDLGMFACDAHVKGWTESQYRIASPFVE